MKKTLRFRGIIAAGFFAFVLTLGGCAASAPTEEGSSSSQESQVNTESVKLQIFAANSLSEALDEVQELYTTKHPEVSFADTQYEASGTLNAMLAAGSQADLLITASKSTMDTAVEQAYVDSATRFDMFLNDLVIVAGENSDIANVSLEDIANGSYRIAVGDDNVPAGNYAKQALSTVGCWNDPEGAVGRDSAGKGGTFTGTPLEGRVIEGSSVGNVCSYANSGDVDLAIVYSSDVYRFGGVKIVGTIPTDLHKTIVYPAAVTQTSEHSQAVQDFLDWCITDTEALALWQKWGFELV